MINRFISLSVLSLSFGLVILGVQTKPDVAHNINIFGLNITIPVIIQSSYVIWSFGILALVMCLFFSVMTFNKVWSNKVEENLKEDGIYFFVLVVFWLMYLLSYLKGLIGVMDSTAPRWIVYVAVYMGFALIWYIPVAGFIKRPSKDINQELIADQR